jgi:Uma2 family endonuclease
MVTTKLYTAKDLEERSTEFKQYELVRGELVPMSPSSGPHGLAASTIHGLLFMHVFPRKMGQLFIAEAGFIVARDPDSVLAPDVAFIRGRDRPKKIPNGFVPFAPDLAVEVESPTNRLSEIREKIGLYLSGGTEAVWLICPSKRTVTVYKPGIAEQALSDTDILDGGDVIPGFSIELKEFFAALDLG